MVPDNRFYSLISESDPSNLDKHSTSGCFNTTETEFGDVVFRGPLEGAGDCIINRISNVVTDNDGSLADIYQGYVGYDDLWEPYNGE